MVKLERRAVGRRLVVGKDGLIVRVDRAVRGTAARSTPPLVEERDVEARAGQLGGSDRAGDAAADDRDAR